MNKKYFLIITIIFSLVQPAIIDSNLIEFDGKYYIPNNYRPYLGKVVEYFPDGNTISYEGFYNDGFKDSVWTYYNINGETIYQKTYIENGYINEEFYPNLQTKVIGKYINGKKDGPWIKYYKNGSIESEVFFKDGLIDIYESINYEEKKEDIITVEVILEVDTLEVIEDVVDSLIIDVKNGQYIKYYEDGSIKRRENFIDGKLHGLWIEYYQNGREYINRFFDYGLINKDYNTIVYYESGNKKEEFNEIFENDIFIKNGRYISYYIHGSKYSEGSFDNDVKVGVWEEYYETGEPFVTLNYSHSMDMSNVYVTYYYQNGNPLIESTVLRNNESIFDGEYRSFYLSGTLQEKGKYDNGLKDGLWYEYYEDGNTFSVADYTNGNGIYNAYYNSGELMIEGFYSNDKKDDLWIEFYKNGNRRKEMYFLNDFININEPILEYREDGSKYLECYYKSDGSLFIKDGLCTEYYPSENIKLQGLYKNDFKDNKWIGYYDNGSQMSEAYYENGNGSFISYYESGNILTKGEYLDFSKNGKWIDYYENGNKLREYYYSDDMIDPNRKYTIWYENGYKKIEGYLASVSEEVIYDGYFIEYYDNGVIFLEGNYLNGLKVGVWRQYYNSRILAVEKTFDNGNPAGEWIFYNENGDVVKKEIY